MNISENGRYLRKFAQNLGICVYTTKQANVKCHDKYQDMMSLGQNERKKAW